MKQQSNDQDQKPSMFNTQSGKTEPRAIEKPSISLPKGGGAIKGIDEKFSVNAANGTASFSLPLPVAPARGVAPEMSLTYNSGNGNGVFGLGWNVDIGSIKRKTNQELPQYLDSADSDTYLFAGAEDLVPEFQKEPDGTFSKDPKGNYVILERNSSDGGFTIRCYRPRIEGLFTRIERWMHKTTGVIKWRVITKENTTTLLGWTAAARIADPADPRRVYEWLPEFVFDDSGNCCHYIYKAEDDAGFDPTLPHNANRRQNGQLTYANQYLSSIRYGNKTPYQTFDAPFPAEQDYMFQTVFDYGEYDSNSPYQKINDWLYRPDAFSDYKAGFEIRTTRLCQRVLLFHYFDELPSGNALVKSLNFTYDTSREQGFTFLTSVAIYGYVKKPDNTYTHKQMPPIEFAYQEHAWSKTVRTVNTEALVHAPAGLHESTYQFTDLYGEGLSGILTEQDGAWYYKRNLGGGKFARAAKVSPKPTFKGLGDKVYLADLDGDGSKQLVSTAQPPQGFFELDNNQGGPTFRTFKHQPNVNFKDQNTRMIDITGDGKPDLLITEDQVFTWYESEGREGYKSARRTPKPFDEEKGPAVIFADSKQTIFLADMDGDGLTDIVRIRANETCYWPNLGYGRFGSKVAMDNPPNLDAPDSFNPSYVRLGDIDGSGTTDIIYLGRQKFSCWLNLNGNAFTSTPFEITAFPEIHNSATVTLADLLGTGTLCIVWSSPLAKDAQSPLRYIDLMDSKKPHVMTGYQNNFGKEVRLHYKPSTAFYLEAEKAGRPWVTKLHFPLQCLAKSEIIDHVTGQEFASTYAYHHGYYDHAEREFRGFGLVEQTDTEEFDHWTRSGNSAVEQDLQQEPVVKKSWFHTGAFLKNQTILHQFAGEYWYTEMARHGFSVTHNEHDLPDARLHAAANIDPILLDHLTGQERQQAVRACKGTVLRTEIFAHDAPAMDATPDELQRQLTPYTVETKNCNIELLQPKGQNKYAVFITKESETLTYAYERDTTDPRITHNLNLVFDEYGNVLESAQVVYAREIAEGGLPAAVQQAQTRTYITYKSIKLTNDVLGDDVYRLRVPSEDRTYELRGVAKSGNYYLPANFDNIFAVATEIPYHQKDNNPPSGSPQKRLVEHFRSTYRKNDLTGPLPLHQLESRALPFESYQLAYTPELLTNIFGVHATDALMLEGKFTHSEGDANWWVRSGTTQYLEPGETISDAANRFFVPLSYTDPFGAVTKVTYLGDFTFVASTEDALGNKTSIDVFSYRTLSPLRVRDMNDNLSEVIYDELGRVKASAQLGKGAEADDLAGLQEITTPLEETEVAAFFNAVNPSELTARGKALLGHASVRMVYNLTAFQTSGKPVASASITREQHFKDNAGSPVQLSFEYTGGLAQVVMKKNQAEPGPAKKLDLAPDNTYVLTTVDTSPELRWVGTGRTVLNNKGNPVKQYEPYFSVTHQYEDNKELVESGVTPLFYYDALGREVKVDLPDGTFSKVAFTSWQQTLYDPGDTVKDSAWYNNRVNSIINAELLAEGKDPLKEKLAAIASEQYYDTPTVQYFDTLGRGIMQVQHNRVNGTDELYQSQVVLDIEGNLRQVIDARGNAVMNYAHDMLGRGVYQNSPDSGKRWQLANVMGESLRAWDERNHEFQYVYDLLGRALQTRVVGGDGDTPLNNIYERIVYGESLPNPKAKNLRGEVMRFYDTGGLVETREYDFKGQPLSNNRRLFASYKGVPNWTDANLAVDLEPEIFTTTTIYDALGRAIQVTMPDGSVEQTTFNAASLLETKSVTQGLVQETIIQNIDYNETGKRLRLVLGNGVTTTYRYDKQSFSLLQVTSRKANNQLLQDLHYTFDATGNVTHVKDRAVPITFFNNQMITGLSTYTYDALYQLIKATGRENNAALDFGPEDNWNDHNYFNDLNIGDPTAIRNYTELYDYDEVGNILQIDHQASGNNWMRDYIYAAGNNRLLGTKVGSQTYAYVHHAQHGFITDLPHLEDLSWNFKEKLVRSIRQKAATGTPETTYYQYAADGQRLRKITEAAAAAGETPAKKEERVYIGSYELYKKHSGEHVGFHRHSLSVVDTTGRIAMIETRNDIDDGTEKRLVRYQIANHLGSVNLEVDANANVISYEEYHPFGTTAYRALNKAVHAAAKRYRFTGMERDDETGLSYHSARYYLPWLGRWLSGDPSGIDDGLNVYRYAQNNPVTLTDTNGNESDEQKASRMFEEFLTQQGVNFKKEVPFRVEVNGKWVEGRADFFVQTNSGKWEPVEMKGKANSPWTKAQKEYLPALQKGAKFETIGTSKFSTPVTGSGGGKVFNVHTVAKGKFDFQKLFTTEVKIRNPADPSKNRKQTITKDVEGKVVSSEVKPDLSPPGTRLDADVKGPKVKGPKGPKGPKVKGKGLLGGLIVAGGILLFTGDAKAAGQSLNPAADTTDAVIEDKGAAEIAAGVALDIASLIPQVAIVRTGIALNQAAMEASHFPVPEGWVEQKVAEGRNPFCAICHGEGNLRDKWSQQKEQERLLGNLQQFQFPSDPAADAALLEYIKSMQKQ